MTQLAIGMMGLIAWNVFGIYHLEKSGGAFDHGAPYDMTPVRFFLTGAIPMCVAAGDLLLIGFAIGAVRLS